MVSSKVCLSSRQGWRFYLDRKSRCWLISPTVLRKLSIFRGGFLSPIPAHAIQATGQRHLRPEEGELRADVTDLGSIDRPCGM